MIEPDARGHHEGLLPAWRGGGGPVYAWGTVRARFPSLSVEKEFYQAMGNGDASFNIDDETGLINLNLDPTLNKALYPVLSKPENVYLAREMCWILQSPAGTDAFLIQPSEDHQLPGLITSIQPGANGDPTHYALVGRVDGGGNPMCGVVGLSAVSLITLFTPPVATPAKMVPTADAGNLSTMVAEVLTLAGNPGESAEDRALNYVVLNYAPLYQKFYEVRFTKQVANPDGFSMTAVETRPRSSRDGRLLVDVIFEFQGQDSGAIKSWYCSVDVSTDFPFVAIELQRNLRRG